MTGGNLLIVDDNKNVLSALSIFLNEEFDRLITINNPKTLVSTLQSNKIDVVLLDMNFKAGESTGNEGIYWLNEIKKIDKHIEIIMFTAYGDVELAVKALKIGACDFVLKPWDNDKLLATLHSAMKLRKSNLKVEELACKERGLKDEMNREQKLLIGNSTAMLKIRQIIGKVAKTDANILITGENGTGKEVIAREIHHQSLRANELLVSVDISSVPDTLVESELFGHKKGAFTDACEDRIGKFQLAHNGTLFLDEIGNIPLPLQAKLLVALQTRMVTPVGANRQIPVNIRLISATNNDINDMIDQNYFREDLLYRINTIHIEIPPLRERQEDIAVLSNFFLKRYASKYRKHQLKIGTQALNKLQKYHWPGNVRELEHTIEKAVILSDTNTITPDNFFFKNTSSARSNTPQTLEEVEKQLILDARDRHDGNLSVAARQLGITRQTFYNKLKKYDV
ncbi:MAG: response regulator [Bacteroidetes bacterium]|jgi:DNA-binding NtrC family response regulator|nr:response regulator [Bacteroidota bacterium]